MRIGSKGLPFVRTLRKLKKSSNIIANASNLVRADRWLCDCVEF